MSYHRGLSIYECSTTFDSAIARQRSIRAAGLHQQVLHKPLMKKLRVWRRIHGAVQERDRARKEGRPFNQYKYPADTRQAFEELDFMALFESDSDDDDSDNMDDKENSQAKESHVAKSDSPSATLAELARSMRYTLGSKRKMDMDSSSGPARKAARLDPSQKLPTGVVPSSSSCLTIGVSKNRPNDIDSTGRTSPKLRNLAQFKKPTKSVDSSAPKSPVSKKRAPKKRTNVKFRADVRYVSTQLYSPLAHFSS